MDRNGHPDLTHSTSLPSRLNSEQQAVVKYLNSQPNSEATEYDLFTKNGFQMETIRFLERLGVISFRTKREETGSITTLWRITETEEQRTINENLYHSKQKETNMNDTISVTLTLDQAREVVKALGIKISQLDEKRNLTSKVLTDFHKAIKQVTDNTS